MLRSLAFCFLYCVVLASVLPNAVCYSQDKQDSRGKNEDAKKEKGTADAPPPFEMSREVAAALNPLFNAIRKAPVTRSTIALSAETIVDGAIIDTQTSTYQIASKAPDEFTVYLKETQRKTRIYNSGGKMTIALSPTAFVRLPNGIDNQSAVFQLPVPMGPYPEAPLALSLAGADPADTLASGMQSLELVDRRKFRGKQDAIHFRGIQDDLVRWDLWTTQDKSPRPLRLVVDLTEMLKANGQLDMSEGYRFQLRFDFTSWRATGTIDTSMFRYKAGKGAVEYKSLQAYAEKLATDAARYPLLGKVTPKYITIDASEKEFDSAKLKGKIQVVKFWSTGCGACVDMMPTAVDVVSRYRGKGVVLVPINVGEQPDTVNSFIKEKEWKLQTAMDVDSKIATGFGLLTIPMTILIGKDGVIEAVYPGPIKPDDFAKQLAKDIDTLVKGGRIAKRE